MRKWANNSKINLKVAGLCFLIAATFWFFQAMSKDHTSVISFDLEVRYDQRLLVETSPPSETLKLNVSGYGWNLFFKKLGFSKSTLFINAAECPRLDFFEGSKVAKMLSDQLEEVQINYVVTDTIFLNLDHSASKEIRLDIDRSKLEEGVVFNSDIDISPNIVHVSGPQQLLDQLSDPLLISVNKLNQGHSLKNYKLKLVPLFSDKVNCDEQEVLISIEASKFVTRKLNVSVEKIRFPVDRDVVEEIEVSYVSDVDHPLQENQIQLQADFRTFRKSDSTVVVQLISRPSYVKKLVPSQKRLKVSYDN